MMRPKIVHLGEKIRALRERKEQKKRKERKEEEEGRRNKRREGSRYGILHGIYICLEYVWIISMEKVYGMVWN